MYMSTYNMKKSQPNAITLTCIMLKKIIDKWKTFQDASYIKENANSQSKLHDVLRSYRTALNLLTTMPPKNGVPQ